MDEQAVIEILSGERRDWTAFLLRRLTEIAEPFYWGSTAFRNALFQSGLKRMHRLDVPVLSVGNITTGGTGKTPVVAWLAGQLQQECSVGLLSRGYREMGEEGNDEYKVLKTILPDVPHLQRQDRVSAGRELIEQGAECLILDDGFQHRRLARDVDVVLIDATNPFGYGHCLPRGLLRESLAGLSRASAFLITRSDLVSEAALATIESQLQRYSSASIWRTRFQPTALVNALGKRQSLDAFREKGQSVALSFCGLGNPKAFVQSVTQLGLTMSKTRHHSYPDHHHYSLEDWSDITTQLSACGEQSVGLTTLKDLVKLPRDHSLANRVYALEIELEFASEDEGAEFLHMVKSTRLR